MDFNQLVKSRYSARKYKEREVEREVLEEILDTVRNAPSAVNYQPWQFRVIVNEEIKARVAETYPVEWIKKAPVIIVALGDHSQSWIRDDGKDHCDIDVSIAVDHLTLAAAEKGLGTCWVCAFDKDMLVDILSLPEHLEPIALIPLGYSIDQDIRPKKRKTLEEIVVWL